MFDLISIGDTVIDTVVPLVDAEIIRKDGQSLITLPLGSKIPVSQSTSTVGGNAANNAIGSSRLKLNTAIYTHVGNKDEEQADDRIKAKLRWEGVSLKYVVETEELPSSHNIVLHFEGERTILTHHQPWKYSLPDLDKAKWLYLTSLSPTYIETNLMDQLINYLERSGAKLAFQPGTFQIKLGIKKQPRLLSLSELFIVNKEEAKIVLGYSHEARMEIKKLLRELQNLGPKLVVITDGSEGSYGNDGETFWKLPAFPCKLVERTGAGDAFATGVLAGLINKKPLSEALRWGAANAASVVEQIGTQAGLLTYDQLQERLKENSKIIAVEI